MLNGIASSLNGRAKGKKRVIEYIEHVLTSPAGDYMHLQSVNIPERTHQQLRALSEITGHTKSALAAGLLVAALEDALEALPSEPMPGVFMPDRELDLLAQERGEVAEMKPASLRDIVRKRADELYRELLDQHHLEEQERGNAVQGDD